MDFKLTHKFDIELNGFLRIMEDPEVVKVQMESFWNSTTKNI